MNHPTEQLVYIQNTLAIDLVIILIITIAIKVIIQSKSERDAQNSNTKSVDNVTHDAKQCYVCVFLGSGIVSSIR